jgi:hypothetical protein
MNLKKYFSVLPVFLLATLFIGGKCAAQNNTAITFRYYVSNSGDDSNLGTVTAPFKTIQKVNSLKLKPGTMVYFEGGETFKGTLTIGPEKEGTKKHPVIFLSHGNKQAIISADSVRAVSVYKTAYVWVMDLKLQGLGRKTGNRENGIAILNSENINAKILDISGFQKSGLLVDSSSHINCEHIFAHDNGSAGITVEGRDSKKDSRDIQISECRAENNPGDPTKLDNHSGNGIVVGHCTNVVIASCTATNNGWDMPRIGNGPVGIWCYEADSVIIQLCLSYNNKTSKGGADGGGFDLDGGTTNSIIQHCYSYGNQGSGYCIFQYWGASAWHDNIIRNNISENDGTVSDSQAGLYIWNSSGDPRQFYNCKVYDNIIYNSKVAAISFSDKSVNGGFDFHHNIFVGKDSLIKGRDSLGKCRFEGNDWWSLQSGFNIYGIKNFKIWSDKAGQEQKDGKLTGWNIDPKFKDPDITKLTDTEEVHQFSGFTFSEKSKLRNLFGGDLAQTVEFNIMY